MRRSALALGASVLALVLTAGPANAAPEATQTVDHSALTTQVGSVDANVPVRVASDGDNAGTAAGGGGPQTTTDSAGTAQAGAVQAHAPVRVLSDGDNGSSAAGSGGGSQATTGSAGTAQIASLTATAPSRVASDGADAVSGRVAGGSQTTTQSLGTLQIGSGVAAQASSMPGTVGTGQQMSSPGATTAPPSPGSRDGGGLPSEGGLDRATQPAVDVVAGDNGAGSSPNGVRPVAAEGLGAGGLPLTGLGLITAIAAGLLLFSNGLALRLTGRDPGGVRTAHPA